MLDDFDLDPSEDAVHAHAVALRVAVKVTNLRGRNSSMILRWPEGGLEIRLEKGDQEDEKRFSLAYALAKVELLGESLQKINIDNHKCRFPRAELVGPDRDEILFRALELVMPLKEFVAVYKESGMSVGKTSDHFKVPVTVVNLRLDSIGFNRRIAPTKSVGALEAAIAGQGPGAIPVSAEIASGQAVKQRAEESGFGVRGRRDRRDRPRRAAVGF